MNTFKSREAQVSHFELELMIVCSYVKQPLLPFLKSFPTQGLQSALSNRKQSHARTIH